MHTSPHPDQLRWNEKYRSKGPEMRPLQAAAWLSQHEYLLADQPKGAALDIACGNGRNSFYLAGLGFEVDALDISDVAIEWVRQQAQTGKAAVQPYCLNLEATDFPRADYQVIVNFFYLQRSLFRPIQAALAPGGLLFFETYYLDQRTPPFGGMNPHFLLAPDELRHGFEDLQVLNYEAAVLPTAPHERRKSVARLIAQKPKT